MRAGKLTRWQKAGALVPMAVLVGAWGVALANSGLASATDGTDPADVPSVPSTAFDDPASVQEAPAGIDPRAGTEGTVATLSTDGIPNAALSAYKRAETLLAQADATCRLPWNLVAAIGRVESNHGRTGGNQLDGRGTATPGIFGPQLNGSNNTAKINDTDSGTLDQDAVFDRAVGPMQFIPGTWKAVGVDADNDGVKNPQNINDAATSAGIYLCAGPGDLSNEADLRSAVLRYNRSDSYADTVIAISQAYAQGNFTQSPNNLTSSSPLVQRSSDQSITSDQRQAAANDEVAATTPPPGGGTTTNPGGGGTSTPGGGGGTSTPTSPGGATGSGSTSGLVTGLVNDLTGQPVPGSTAPAAPLGNTMSWLDAKTRCLATGLTELNVVGLLTCITDLLG
ncbi:lytic transglycosylase domain-containing protein [Aeromicrobium sp. Leaf350]|uniref:lytic transglycosylase domain-containing protein n=1 Tax=Aeromicrobium sp. Leaf350 TaxID=2876565 RepID=UPI001E55FF40|nr:lytic murein transglycosylase [Aeromicrobium sp. Leaf350]